MKFAFLPIILIVLLAGCSVKQSSLSEIIKVEEGKIQGIHDDQSDIYAFKGVPFAAPPTGDLRWKAPQQVKSWNGIKNCTEFGPSAMQGKPEPFSMWTSEFIAPAKPLSEDCLYLNVWTGAKNNKEKRPVLVFIHGGAFMSGSGSVPVYDGVEMAKKGLVFVTINYRLGIFGFLAHPELTAESPNKASGNYGLLDQIEALKWVQENIKAFGGDPSNVTIAGQSAGAFSVNFLVASPLAKGLFHRAIAESGGAVLPTGRFSRNGSLKEAEQSGLSFAEKAGASDIKQLRQIPADSLLKIQTISGPVIDGYVLPKSMHEIFENGEQNDVPVLTGWNANEGLGGPPMKSEDYVAATKDLYKEKADLFLQYFPGNTDEQAQESQEILSSLKTFGIQAFHWMNLQNQTGKSKVFMYQFTRRLPFGEGQKDYGAFHTGEVPYAYNNLKISKIRPWQEADHKLADEMSDYWVNFATNGNPNGPGLPEWSPCQPDAYSTMFLGETLKLKQIPYLKRLKFLEGFYLENMNQKP